MWEQLTEISCNCKATLSLRDPPLERLRLTRMEGVWNDPVERTETNDRRLRNVEQKLRTQQVMEGTTSYEVHKNERSCRVSGPAMTLQCNRNPD